MTKIIDDPYGSLIFCGNKLSISKGTYTYPKDDNLLLHSEENAISFRDVKSESILLVTTLPCVKCMKLLIQDGSFKYILYENDMGNYSPSLFLAAKNGIGVFRLSDILYDVINIQDLYLIRCLHENKTQMTTSSLSKDNFMNEESINNCYVKYHHRDYFIEQHQLNEIRSFFKVPRINLDTLLVNKPVSFELRRVNQIGCTNIMI
jgi:deoxycytidylate deaminase